MSKEKKSVSLSVKLKEAGEDPKLLAAVALAAITALTSAEGEIDAAFGIIEEQAQKIENAQKSNPDYRPEVKVKKGSVRINHSIRDQKGNILTPDQIAEDPKLIDELLKAESTAVTLLPNS